MKFLMVSSSKCSRLPTDTFKESCELHADLSELICERTLVRPFRKKAYWRVEFDVELKFGTTELEAAILWNVNVNVFCPCDVYTADVLGTNRA